MALDGAYIRFLVNELNNTLSGARVEKVYQPEKDEITLQLHTQEGGVRLLFSASPNNPRFCITSSKKENPQSPPMFCMLLRKHLIGSKVASFTQEGMERIVRVDFDCLDELSEPCRRTLICEIMGRHSNLIFTDENGRIIDSIKHIGFAVSTVRQVQPGMQYKIPPSQDKIDILKADTETIKRVIKAVAFSETTLEKAVLGSFTGLSPSFCREAAYIGAGDVTAKGATLLEAEREKFEFILNGMLQDVVELNGKPYIIKTPSGEYTEFSHISLKQYGQDFTSILIDSFSEAVDEFYRGRDASVRKNQRGADTEKLVNNALEKLSRKLNMLIDELNESKDREKYRIYADLINANLHKIEKGINRVNLENFYDESGSTIEIPLDVRLSPAQNAQKYYKEYAKKKTAEQKLITQIEQANAEIAYLNEVLSSLSIAENEKELSEIREELSQTGYIKRRILQKNRKKVPPSQPLSFLSSNGFKITAGKNNFQNDRITVKDSAKTDLWFHVKDLAGSHVVIKTDGVEVPDKTILEAATIAATFSKAALSGKTAVDYTIIKNVKKPSGAKPGMVTYDNYNTVYVAPDKEICEKLKKNNV